MTERSLQLESRVSGVFNPVGGIQEGFLEVATHEVSHSEGPLGAGRGEGEGHHRH